VTAQILDRVLRCYRIGDPDGRHPIFDATGSTLAPGRWNTPGTPIIYASEHYSTAMLEKLVHGNGMLPPNQHYVEITIPNGASYEVLNEAAHPDWHERDMAAARAFGSVWASAKRSLILLVPSVVARVDRNVLINPQHPEFPRVKCGLHQPVWWDARLFG
jgi:RES domain-containing protein